MSKSFWVLLGIILTVYGLGSAYLIGVWEHTCYINSHPKMVVLGFIDPPTSEVKPITIVTTTEYVSWETLASDKIDLSDFYVIHGALELNQDSNNAIGFVLANLREAHVDKVLVILSSYGGTIDDSMAIYDILMFYRHQGMTIYTFADGYCYSGGAVIMQAGEKRYLSRHGQLMIHDAYYRDDSGIKPEDIPKCVNGSKVANGLMLHILMERTGNNQEVVKLLTTAGDHYITPKEAKRLNLIDGVL